MKFENWKDGAELVGIVAIVASLVFVGIQLKQSQDIAASQIYQERTNASVAAAIAIAQNKDIISAMVKGGSNDFESITSAEQIATVIAISGYAMLWDNAYYQYEQGYLSSDGWERIRNDIKVGLRGPLKASRGTEVDRASDWRTLIVWLSPAGLARGDQNPSRKN